MFGMNDDTWFRVVSVSYFVAASLSIFAGVAQYRVSNRISDRKDAELAQYKVEATAKLADAQKQAAIANQQAANANREAALANKAAAELNEKAAKLEADNLRLKKQLAWRSIDSRQRTAIVNEISGVPGVPATLVSIMGDSEGRNYANQFADILRASGWNLSENDISQAVFAGNPPVGVIVWTNPADRDNPSISNALHALVSVLNQEKIMPELIVRVSPEAPRGRVKLVIGAKPPFQEHEKS